jgi:hypothetical protein
MENLRIPWMSILCNPSICFNVLQVVYYLVRCPLYLLYIPFCDIIGGGCCLLCIDASHTSFSLSISCPLRIVAAGYQSSRRVLLDTNV